jgi:hypothetical protein
VRGRILRQKSSTTKRECDGSCRMGAKTGSVLGRGISVFGETLDDPFIGNDASIYCS